MYNAHFGFQTSPFSMTGDSQFFYKNSLYREAAISLLFSVRQRQRFILLTGESGIGKTTLWRHVASQLTSCCQTLYIPRCPHTFEDLLLTTGHYREGEKTAHSLPLMLQLRDILELCYHTNERLLLFLDEAQHLSNETLVTLDLLLNLQTRSDSLLTLVLSGTPLLAARFQQPVLSDFQKCIDLHLRLHPLRPEEIPSYISYRVNTAGSLCPDLFSSAALERVAYYSKGNPRLVNLFCDNALQAAHLTGKYSVSAELLDNVAQALIQAEREAPTQDRQEIPVVVLPDPQPTPQSVTYPVVVKQRTERLSWAVIILLIAWFTLFQATQPLQLTQHSDPQQAPSSLALLSVSTGQQPQSESDAVKLVSALHATQPQEQQAEKGFASPERASEPRERQLIRKETTRQNAKDPSPMSALARRQQPSASNTQASLLLASSSPSPRPTSQLEASRLQLAQKGIAATSANLIARVEQGDLQTVQLLLTAGVSPNTGDAQGWTPLMFAARDDRRDMARLLITSGADVNKKNKTGGTALIMAAMNNHSIMAETLIRKGARLDTQTAQGWTALTYAAWKGHGQIATLLLNKGAKTQIKDHKGWTPLMYASWRHDTHAQQKQLQKDIAEALGIDIQAEPLPVASGGEYIEVAQLLRP